MCECEKVKFHLPEPWPYEDGAPYQSPPDECALYSELFKGNRDPLFNGSLQVSEPFFSKLANKTAHIRRKNPLRADLES